MSATNLGPRKRIAAAVLGALMLVPPVMARLGGAETWKPDWIACAVLLLLAGATGLGRADAPSADMSAERRERRKLGRIARAAALLFAAILLIATANIVIDGRWADVSAPLFLLGILALYAGVSGADLLDDPEDRSTEPLDLGKAITGFGERRRARRNAKGG